MKYPISISQDLRRNTFSGKYYAFEGIDGCGKSTQVEKIKKYLQKQGKKVVITSEPMATGAIQEIIRATLFNKIKIPAKAYQDLYSADREVNHVGLVEPALKDGKTVLTHRSFWSAVAYGILDLGEEYKPSVKALPIMVAHGIISNYHQFLTPDKTFYLKISARRAMERLRLMSKEKDIYEKGEKLAKIVYGYDTLVAKFPKEFIVIDGEKSEEEVTAEIIKNLDLRIKN